MNSVNAKYAEEQGNRIVIKSLKEKQKLKIGDSHLFQDLSVKNKVYMQNRKENYLSNA